MDATSASAAEKEVRAVLDSYMDAIRATDVDRIVQHYAPDIVSYDAIAKLEFVGREAYTEHWRACMEMCEHMVFEPQPATIAASGDVAFAYSLARCGGIGPDGKEHMGWMRGTQALRKVNGRWLIVHEHYSAPFDPISMKILEDLELEQAASGVA